MKLRPLGIAAALSLLVGCGHPVEQKSLSEVKGTPDIVAEAAQPGSKWRAFDLRAFQINQIGGVSGPALKDGPPADYRAKITLWDSDPEQAATAVAEIFFCNPEQLVRDATRGNPDPNNPKDPANQNAQGKAGRTYRLYFPASTMDSVLQTLRFANGDVYLYYYNNQWSIGTSAGEVIGSN